MHLAQFYIYRLGNNFVSNNPIWKEWHWIRGFVLLKNVKKFNIIKVFLGNETKMKEFPDNSDKLKCTFFHDTTNIQET